MIGLLLFESLHIFSWGSCAEFGYSLIAVPLALISKVTVFPNPHQHQFEVGDNFICKNLLDCFFYLLAISSAIFFPHFSTLLEVAHEYVSHYFTHVDHLINCEVNCLAGLLKCVNCSSVDHPLFFHQNHTGKNDQYFVPVILEPLIFLSELSHQVF